MYLMTDYVRKLIGQSQAILSYSPHYALLHNWHQYMNTEWIKTQAVCYTQSLDISKLHRQPIKNKIASDTNGTAPKTVASFELRGRRALVCTYGLQGLIEF